jgi:hypothetical protein
MIVLRTESQTDCVHRYDTGVCHWGSVATCEVFSKIENNLVKF